MFTMNMYGRALPQLAVLYTHKGKEEWEQQQMQHVCHDHSLGREMWGSAVSKTVKEDEEVLCVLRREFNSERWRSDK